MGYQIRRVDYFYTTIEDQPGEAYKVLSALATVGINLLAFTGIPVGPVRTQLTVFPDDPREIASAAKQIGFALDGPHPALLVQGDDELGALASIHESLLGANVNVYASSGVVDGKGSFGYVLYIRPDEIDRASAALGV